MPEETESGSGGTDDRASSARVEALEQRVQHLEGQMDRALNLLRRLEESAGLTSPQTRASEPDAPPETAPLAPSSTEAKTTNEPALPSPDADREERGEVDEKPGEEEPGEVISGLSSARSEQNDAAGGDADRRDADRRDPDRRDADRRDAHRRDAHRRDQVAREPDEPVRSRDAEQGLPGRAAGILKSVLGTTTEEWLSRIGIALLLFGVAFLFRYAIEQNWVGPIVRVAFGLLLGGGLLYGGLRLYEERRTFSQVLLGGSSAVFYLTVFGAYQVFELTSYLVAFTAMVTVTVGTFGLAVRQQSPVMAVIGAAGAYATPFLLYKDDGSVVGLVVYAVIVLAMTVALFWRRGWVAMLYTSITGMWVVTLLAWFSTLELFGLSEATWVEAMAVQVSAGAAWLSVALLPLAYRFVRYGDVSDALVGWLPKTGRADGAGSDRSFWTKTGIVTSSITSPTLLLVITGELWSLGDGAVSLLMLGLAVLYAILGEGAGRAELRLERAVYAVIASLLVTGAVGWWVEGPYLLVMLAAQAFGLLVIVRNGGPVPLRWVGHGLFALVAGLALQIDIGRIDSEISTQGGRLLVALLTLSGSFLVRGTRIRWAYQGVGAAVLMGWTVGAVGETAYELDVTRLVWIGQGAALVLAAEYRAVLRERVPLPVLTDASLKSLQGPGYGIILLSALSLLGAVWAPVQTPTLAGSAWTVDTLLQAIALCLYVAGSARLGESDLSTASRVGVHLLVAVWILARLGEGTMLRDGAPLVLLGWSLHTAGLWAAHRRLDSTLYAILSYVQLGVAGLLLAQILIASPSGVARGVAALASELSVIAIGAGMAWMSAHRRTEQIIGVGMLTVWLGWTVDVLTTAGLASILWGATAISAIAGGTLRDRPDVRYAGFATLLLVVGKLFLFDLAALSPVARILLFLGFGAVLLIAGYVLPKCLSD